MRALPSLPALILAAATAGGCAAPASPPPVAEGGHPLSGVVWDVEAGARIEPATLARRLDAADVAVLGEIHDNPVHHERQAWLIGEIDPAGVAFEMVPEASEAGIAVYRAQGAPAAEIGPAIGWERLGWPDWSMYRPVFEAVDDAVITGGGVPRGALVVAMREGASRAFGEGARAAGLAEPLPEAERAALRAEMVAAHCDMLPAEMAGGMVEAQRLRDARFAEAALRARREGGGQAVLVTGNGHARRDRGVPVYLANLAPGATIASLGQVEVTEGRDDPAAYAAEDLPYDYVWFSEAVADRPDPCERFRRG